MMDILREAVIRRYYHADAPLHILASTASTNADARALAADGAPEGTAVIADTQTRGRGRLGRTFASPAGTGVYLSVVLRPSLAPTEVTRITTAAAVAAARVCEREFGRDCGIKWVNDLYLGEKKVAGILVEGAIGASGTLEYAILGIGVNLYTPPGGFPPETDGIAGALLPAELPDARSRFIGAFLAEFLSLYKSLADPAILAEYRRRCFLIGRQVSVLRGDAVRQATVLALDDGFCLLVRYADGSTEALSSGDVRLKI